jgi:radical SAM protein with 4Fe4S-binding SPASM domain
MALKVAKWITNIHSTEKIEQFRVHILGGEPFLNFEVISYFIEMINALKPEFTKPPEEGGFVIFTNGDYLNEENLSILKRLDVKIMLNPCNDELDVVEEKILKIKKVSHGCSLAVTLDNFNLNRLGELTDLAINYECHIRTNRLYHGGTIPGYVERFHSSMTVMFDKLLKSKWIMWPNFIMESTYPTWNSPKNPNACGRWLLVVDVNGNIRSCNADMETKIGHISTHTKMSDFKFSHRWSAKDLPECQGCEWITWCQGGCPYTRKLVYGTYNKRSPFCSAFKQLFPKLMLLRDKWKSQIIM